MHTHKIKVAEMISYLPFPNFYTFNELKIRKKKRIFNAFFFLLLLQNFLGYVLFKEKVVTFPLCTLKPAYPVLPTTQELKSSVTILKHKHLSRELQDQLHYLRAECCYPELKESRKSGNELLKKKV